MTIIETMQLIIGTIASGIIAYTIITGCGLALYQVLGKRQYSVHDLLLSFWGGWALSIVYIQIWHLFYAVTTLTMIPLVVIAAVGWYLSRGEVISMIQGALSARWWLALCVILVLWMVPHAVVGRYEYDDGLYQIQEVQWITQYSIVPGLGNLHGRLAFNTTHSLFISLLESVPFFVPARHITHLLLFSSLAFYTVLSIKRIIKCESVSLFDYFYPLAFPVFFLSSVGYIAALKNDYAVAAIGLLLAGEILQLSLNRKAPHYSQVMVLMLIALVGITVKMSLVIFSAGLVATLFLLTPANTIRVFFLLGMLTIGTWMIRSIILSGYPVYPIDFLAFPVEWRVSAAQANVELMWIRSWARQEYVSPDIVLASWDWLRPWWELNKYQLFNFILPLAIGTISSIILFIQVMRKRISTRISYIWILPLVGLIGLLYWFFSAPSPRFGLHVFLTLGAVLLILALNSIGRLERRLVLALVCLMMLFVMAKTIWRGNIPTQRDPILPEYELQTTDSGLQVYEPINTDQCWYLPVPCAPRVGSQLALREDDNLQSGFIVR